MPRKSKGARLYERTRKNRPSVWVIKDQGGIEFSTGTSSRREAEIQLADYIGQKFRPSGPVTAEDIKVGHILAIYAEEHAPHVADPARIGYAIDALDPFWGDLPASAVKGATCRRYAAYRDRSDATIRRELGTLQAALNHCAREGYLLGAPLVTLPDKPRSKERWLSRDQAAALLWAARSLRIDGRQQLQRFIITSLYTGTRKTATLALAIDLPSAHAGWIDTERGILYRMGDGETVTNKRRSVARCPARLLAHVRRWKRLGAVYVCENHEGNRVKEVKKGWINAVRIASQIIDMGEGVTPHILKHTAITWAMQNGASKEDAASFFSTTIQTIESTYWHHSPYCQSSVVDAIDNRRSTK
ncbi:MAG: hypothetical protein JKX76_00600 [Colwellia sp.]|nr:hypothetical protein [Colwellia sp.]